MEDKVTLSTIARGAAEELFQQALQAVLANINDMNTPDGAKRSISVNFVFVPNEMRDEVAVSVSVDHKASGMKGTTTRLYTADRKLNGKYPVQEHNPQQMRIMDVTNAGTPAEGKV